jgi:hypothetical protein
MHQRLTSQVMGYNPNSRLAFWDSAGFAEKSLILLLFCRDGKFHPRGAGEGNDGNDGDSAGDLLAPVYGWFTEGFDTADLKEAKGLFDELT